MSSDYKKQYVDFIEAFEKLFRLESNESVEEMCNIITNVLFSKYKLSIQQLTKIIIMAIQYNYASGENYIRILKHIGSNIKRISELIIPREDSIEFIVMHDQIDKFKEYISQTRIDNDQIFLEIPDLEKCEKDKVYNYCPFLKLSLIEACAYFGSVNIFYFLTSNQYCKKTKECLRYSIIGRNMDIINECLKDNEMDIKCLRDIVRTHNNEMLEYVLERNVFTYKDFDVEEWVHNKDIYERCKYKAVYEDVITYQNLNAVFLLFEREKNCIFPWCAAFPQTIDIIKSNKIPDKIDFHGMSILHFACKLQDSDICKLLLDSVNKIYVYDTDNNNEEKTIHSYINIIDEYSFAPLHYAAKRNSKDIAELLISHGADINKEGSWSRTPLHYAAKNNSKEIVELLISHGADVNALDEIIRKPLHYATKIDSIEIVKLLILHGTYINYGDRKNKTPLLYAVKNNSKEIVELLISHGADVNTNYRFIGTPLHFAAERNFKEIAEFLILHGASINARNGDSRTALHLAAKNNSKEIVELLISHGAGINVKDDDFRTALHLAAKRNFKEIAELLISHGADINEEDTFGKTPLYYAAKQSYDKRTENSLLSIVLQQRKNNTK